MGRLRQGTGRESGKAWGTYLYVSGLWARCQGWMGQFKPGAGFWSAAWGILSKGLTRGRSWETGNLHLFVTQTVI